MIYFYIITSLENLDLFEKILVNCEWDQWKIGECSAECGGGTRVDTRNVAVQASNGGVNCSGLSNITENCNIQKCPGSKRKQGVRNETVN